MQPRVLIVEDDERRRTWFAERFAECERDLTDQAAIAIHWLAERDYDLIFLDHDLTEEHYHEAMADDGLTGYVVAAWLAHHPERQPQAQIIIHSLNYAGADRMIEALENSGRKVEHVPFHDLPSIF